MELETMLKFFPPLLRDAIKDPLVSDVMINESGKVFVDRAGLLQRVDDLTVNQQQITIGIQNIARLLGADIDDTRPILDTRLPDGSRVAAVYSNHCMTVTIRKFNRWYSTADLIAASALPPAVRDTVVEALLGHNGEDPANVIVSGGTSSGKSTMVKALLDHVPADSRMIVKPRELAISHENAVRWEARDAVPGVAGVSVAQLLVAALRHRPDRIVIGEVREPSAAYELLQAMNTGHSGTLSTIHADSAQDALHRLADLALAAHSNLATTFVREQVARVIDLVIHVGRDESGRRRVVELGRVRRRDFTIESIYRLKQKEAA